MTTKLATPDNRVLRIAIPCDLTDEEKEELRLSFDHDVTGPYLVTEQELEALVNSRNAVISQLFRSAAYVEYASRYRSLDAVRQHGYSCRAFLMVCGRRYAH
jgi:hypothetical protein